MTEHESGAEQAETPYADALLAHRDRILQRFMIPGHSADQHGGAERLERFLGAQSLQLDVPQMIDGIDIGTRPAYDRARRLAARAWDAHTTWFLTNGASQGNRMALMAARALGERVLVQRSSHSSVYDGLVMSGLEPVYAMPQLDPVHGVAHGVTPDEVDRVLAEARDQKRSIASVVVVSPSYFGTVSDVAGIAEVTRSHGAVLIVDASWGAHFGFHPALPESPTRLGADITISSIHKLGGSLTQTAMLHLAGSDQADRLASALESAYLLTESTSLNSLLLASLDIARSELATGSERIEASLAAADALRLLLRDDPVLDTADERFLSSAAVTRIDPLHVTIDVRGTGFTGMQLKRELAVGAHATFLEIATPTALVALIGAGAAPDPEPLIDAVHHAVVTLSRRRDGEASALEGLARGPRAERETVSELARADPPAPGEAILSPREAYLAPHETVPFDDAVGRIAGEMLAAYPPGVPNTVPGEIITPEAVAYLRAVAASPGGHVRGAQDPGLGSTRVVAAGAERREHR